MTYRQLDKKGITLTVAARKGGSNKSTTTLGLAYALTSLGYKVLLVDCDPQSSLSQALGVNINSTMDSPSLAIGKIQYQSKKSRQNILEDYWVDDLNGEATDEEVLESEIDGLHYLLMKAFERVPITSEDVEKSISSPTFTISETNNKGEIVSNTYRFGFDLIASSDELTDDELVFSLDQDPSRKSIKGLLLTIVLNEVRRYRPEYDFILCDTGPSLGVFTINAMAAAKDGIIVSTNVDDQALWSLQRFKFNVRQIKHLFTNHSGILGVVIGNCEERSQMFPIIADKIQNTLHLYRFRQTISKSANAQKATAAMLLFPQIDSRAEAEFRNLAIEVIERYEACRANDERYAKEVEIEIQRRKQLNPEAYVGLSSEEATRLIRNVIAEEYTEQKFSHFPVVHFEKRKDKEGDKK